MKKCKCEHWQTCPVCYPQGFDEAGNRKPVELPPTREEMLARIKDLEAERDALMSDYQRCCCLVANMHLAAMGGVIGPVRGVVEDVQDLRSDRDALAMQNQQMREALKEMLRNPGGDYTDDIAEAALALPDNTEAIIKRHDAAVLRKAAEHLHAKARAYLNEFDRRVAHDMASALEKSCPPSN